MRKPKILILGHARHGKDEMANTLSRYFDFKAESSSMAAAKIFLYDKLKDEMGYDSLEECHRDRVNHRKRWYDEITNYNKEDLCRLTKEILKENDAYIGLRNPDELFEAKTRDIFDLIVWVDASERVPPESKDSCGVKKEDADLVLTNNGTLSAFREKVIRFGEVVYDYRNAGLMAIPRIGLDVDGVLADFGPHFLKHMHKEGHISDPYTPATSWDDPRFRENFYRIAKDEKFWLGIPPILPGNVIDYPIAAYITARPIHSQVTKTWLTQNGFPEARVITTGVMGSKIDALRMHDIQVFVDDAYHNYTEVEESGVVDMNFLADRVHNRQYDVPYSKRLFHVGELKYRLGFGDMAEIGDIAEYNSKQKRSK